MLRQISWGLGTLSVALPLALYFWQWLQHQKVVESGVKVDELGWTLSVLLVDVFMAGIIAFLALAVNFISLYRLPTGSEYNPVVRIIEMVFLALPLLAGLFVAGVSIIH
ncbi:MAG: hypothetical protein LBN41_10920 [Enterobacteriaceae bacterium]|jgi:hypothetical protein|nr:hypothetical protein [Enterobacteriaceae bacterium]